MKAYTSSIRERSGGVFLLAAYYLLIFLTLNIAPILWQLYVQIFGAPLHFLADSITFLIFGGFLMVVVLQDVLGRRIMNLAKYIALMVIGGLVYATLKSLPNAFERLCIPEYALVCYLTFRVMYRHVKTKAIYLWMFVAIGIFAVTEELMQVFIPDRTFDPRDICFDVWGGTLTLFVIGLTLRPKLTDGLIGKLLRLIMYSIYMYREDLVTDTGSFWFKAKSRLRDFIFSV